LAVLLLGIVSLVVPIPSTQRDSVQAAGITLGVETHHQETVSPLISALIILGGAGMMIAGQLKQSR
jgi:hypothetical protein